MVTDCYGHRMPAISVAVLSLIVVVNVYNLIISSFYDDSRIQILLGVDLKSAQEVIIIQTIATIFALQFRGKQSTSCIILVYIIKYWTFGIILITLFIDLMFTFITADYVLRRGDLDKFWKMKTKYNESKAPGNLYLLAGVILIIYFVFKLYAAYTILRIGKKLNDGVSEDVIIVNVGDLERNAPEVQIDISNSASPPSYNQCVIESAPPPPYSQVSK